MKKTNIVFLIFAAVIVGVVFYYMNMVQSPPVKTSEETVPATTTHPIEDDQPDSNGAGIANPASVYCVEQGGKSEIREGEGGQYGTCVMPDGAECEEWEFFRTKICGDSLDNGGDGGDKDTVCGRENCHGLDIICGANVADACTAVYQLGDKCLRLVNCGVKDGKCQQIENAAFDACKTCVQKCQSDFANDQVKMFDCESKCPAENK